MVWLAQLAKRNRHSSMWRFVAQVCVEQLVTKNVVGTLGLGYPLLLCLGKGLVVILDYIQTAGPLWSGVLFLSTTAPDLSLD